MKNNPNSKFYENIRVFGTLSSHDIHIVDISEYRSPKLHFQHVSLNLNLENIRYLSKLSFFVWQIENWKSQNQVQKAQKATPVVCLWLAKIKNYKKSYQEKSSGPSWISESLRDSDSDSRSVVEPSLESSDGTRHSSGTNTILKNRPMQLKSTLDNNIFC